MTDVSQTQVPETLQMIKRTMVVMDALKQSVDTLKAESVVAAKDAETLAKSMHETMSLHLSKIETLEAKVTSLQQSSAADIARVEAQQKAIRIATEQKAALDQAKAERKRQADIEEAERKRAAAQQRFEDDLTERGIGEARDKALAEANAQALKARVGEAEQKLKAHDDQLAAHAKEHQQNNEAVEALGKQVEGLKGQLEKHHEEEEKRKAEMQRKEERKRQAEEAARRESGNLRELIRTHRSSKIKAAWKGLVVRRHFQLCRDSAAREADPNVLSQKPVWRAAKEQTKRARAMLVALADIDARFGNSPTKARAPVATPLQARDANAMRA